MPIKATRSIATAVKRLACGELPEAPPAHQVFEFLAFADYADAQPLIQVALQALARQDPAQMRASLRAVAYAALGDNAYAQAQRHIVQGLLDHAGSLETSEDSADDTQLAALVLAQATYAARPGARDFMARFAPADDVLQWLQRTEFSAPQPAAMLTHLVARASSAQAAKILAHCLKIHGREPGIWGVVLTALALQAPAARGPWVEKFLTSTYDFSGLPEQLIPMFGLLPAPERQRVLRACSPEKQQQVVWPASADGAGDGKLLADCLAVTPPESGEVGTHEHLLGHAMTLANADLQAMWAQVPTSQRAECLQLLEERVAYLPATAAALRWFFAQPRSTAQALGLWLQSANPVRAWLKARQAAALRGAPAKHAENAASFAAWIAVLRHTQTLHSTLQSITREVMESRAPALLALHFAALAEFPDLRGIAASEVCHGLTVARAEDLTWLVQAAPQWLSQQEIAQALQKNPFLGRAPASFVEAAEAQDLLGGLLTQNFVEGWCAFGGDERVQTLLEACDRHPHQPIDYALCLASVGSLDLDVRGRLDIALALCARLDDAALRKALAHPRSPFKACSQANFMRLAAMATERLGLGDLPVYLSLALQSDETQGVRWALQQGKAFYVLPAALAHDQYAAVMNRSRTGSTHAFQLLLNDLVAGGQLQTFVEARPDCLAHFVNDFAPRLADALLETLLEAQCKGHPWADPAPFVREIDARLLGTKDRRFLVQKCPGLMTFMQADPALWSALLNAPYTGVCSIM